MVQEAVPDGLRGRVFSVYDVMYNLSRLAGGLLAIAVHDTALRRGGVRAFVGLVFILWTPVLPLWLRRAPAAIRLLFDEGGKAEEWPRAVSWGDVEEPVEVVRSATVEERRRTISDLPVIAERRHGLGREPRRAGRRLAPRPRDRRRDLTRRFPAYPLRSPSSSVRNSDYRVRGRREPGSVGMDHRPRAMHICVANGRRPPSPATTVRHGTTGMPSSALDTFPPRRAGGGAGQAHAPSPLEPPATPRE